MPKKYNELVCDTLIQAAVELGCDKELLQTLKQAGCPGFEAGNRVRIEVVRPHVSVMKCLAHPPCEKIRLQNERARVLLDEAKRESNIAARLYFDKRDLAKRLQKFGSKLNQYYGRARLRFSGENQKIYDESYLQLLALIREDFGEFGSMDVTIEFDVK